MMVRARMKRRALILGLDALSYEIYSRLRGYGYLRSLAELEKRAVIGSVHVIPPYTPPAWTSITSGVNPGKHGIYGFLCDPLAPPREARICKATDVRAPRIHNIVNYWGGKSLVVNLPLSSWPYVPFRGYLISDWTSPVQYGHPSFIDEVFRKTLNEHQKERDEVCKLLAHDRAILDTLMKLGDRVLRDVDYVFIMLSFIDEIMHKYPHLLKPPRHECIRDLLEKFDEYVSEVLWPHFLDQHFVLVVSDHGISEVEYIVSIPRILYEHSLVKPVYRRLEDDKRRGSDAGREGRATRLPVNILALIASWLLRRRSIARRIMPFARRLVRRFSLLHTLAASVERPVIDTESSAIIVPNLSYALYVNERVVQNVEQVVEKTIELLYETQETLGHRFLYVATRGRGNVYVGEYAREAPHIVVVPHKGYSFASGLNIYAPIVERAPRTMGDHHVENIHMISVGADTELEEAARRINSHYDYAALVLAALGIPMPSNIDSNIHKYMRGVRFIDYSLKYRISLRLARRTTTG